VNSKNEHKIKDGVAPFLEEGEEVLAAFIAQTRGAQLSRAGGVNLVAGELGHGQARRNVEAAEKAGVEMGGAPVKAFVLTQRRLIVLGMTIGMGFGPGGKVTGLLNAVPIGDVDSVEAKRLGLGQRITLTVRAAPIKLEGSSGSGADVRALALALDSAKAAG
jgi:hypothetical protein